MHYKDYTTEQFEVISNKNNTCDGCWFKDNSNTINCRGRGARFVNSIFSRVNPKMLGSCFKKIAVLKQTATTTKKATQWEKRNHYSR